MTSAFGIDHGEISKVKVTWGGAPDKTARMALTEQARKVGKLRELPKKVVEAPISIGGTGRATSRGVKAGGEGIAYAANKYPGLTGTAILGGGGYAAYRAARQQPPKKKKPKG